MRSELEKKLERWSENDESPFTDDIIEMLLQTGNTHILLKSLEPRYRSKKINAVIDFLGEARSQRAVPLLVGYLKLK